MKVRLKVYVQTNRVGSRIEDEIEVDIDGNESPIELQNVIDEVGMEWVHENIEWGAFIKTDK